LAIRQGVGAAAAMETTFSSVAEYAPNGAAKQPSVVHATNRTERTSIDRVSGSLTFEERRKLHQNNPCYQDCNRQIRYNWNEGRLFDAGHGAVRLVKK
jgi:hypothetical protein